MKTTPFRKPLSMLIAQLFVESRKADTCYVRIESPTYSLITSDYHLGIDTVGRKHLFSKTFVTTGITEIGR